MSPNKEPIDTDELEKARTELLRYYANLQSSQATRLIGFIAGILTLGTVASKSVAEPLSEVFSWGSGFSTDWLLSLPLIGCLADFVIKNAPLLLFWFFAIPIGVLMFFIIRAIFRF